MTPVEKIDLENATLSIFPDENPVSPLEWDNLGTMVCWHRRYNLGNKHSFTPESFHKEVTEDNAIILPIYMMDHSGLYLSTSYGVFEAMDSQRWDWGQVGFIYVLKSKVRKEYGKRITKKVREKVLACLQAEVETYNQFMTGDVYGFVLEDKQGEHLDSCWGFFGSDWKNNGMLDCLPKEQREQVMAKL